jgi:hypothetical protein
MLPPESTDEDILRFIDSWVDDLARGDFVAAYDKTDHDSETEWTPSLMEKVIAGYGMIEERGDPSRERFRVTPRESATGKHFHREVDHNLQPPGAFAVVWYDLPLNGEWSDLTATFRLERKSDGIRVVLEEVHVF